MSTRKPSIVHVTLTPLPAAGARALAAKVRTLAAARPASRSAEALVAGTLAIAVLPAVLPKLVELLNSWMALRKGRTVRVKVSRGDAAIEVEFAPGERGGEEILDFVGKLEKRLDGKAPRKKGRVP